jgi:hypothetical protein
MSFTRSTIRFSTLSKMIKSEVPLLIQVLDKGKTENKDQKVNHQIILEIIISSNLIMKVNLNWLVEDTQCKMSLKLYINREKTKC